MVRDGGDRCNVAIIGSGNIGTDLMIKVLRTSRLLNLSILVGIDRESEGLALANRLGVATTSDGVEGLIASPLFEEIDIIFDATSAKAHVANDARLQPFNKTLIDLTPAAIGPFVVPVVNLEANLGVANINLVTCGGQATIPIVAAVAAVAPVEYAEIVVSIASRSAGPGTRANIDEFTRTTARGLETVGGARRGKAIIVLNPANPPLIMRDTVYCLVADGDEGEITAAVEAMVARVQRYVKGYRLKQAVQFERYSSDEPLVIPDLHWHGPGLKVSVFLEVEGAAHFLPAYAGNLDIMTSAALATAEEIVRVKTVVRA